MKRTPFAVYRKIRLVIDWYGADYSFYRKQLNSYGEPEAGDGNLVQTIRGIYHASNRSFVELVNSEGASVKSKVNKGILCSDENEISLQQYDQVVIEGSVFFVTTVEPVLYSDEIVAYEISLEELVEGNDAE